MKFPSPSIIKQYIQAAEINRRMDFFSSGEVERIFRYGAIIGATIHSYGTLERGMDQARLRIAQHERENRSFPSGCVLVAEKLTGGRGRFQRFWHAPPGGIWMTIVLVNTFTPQVGRLIPLAAGVACCETVNHFNIPSSLKWVNDVHVQGKKICGILVETVIGEYSGEEYVLIGAGLNVNNCSFPAELESLATSMASIAGHEFSLHDVFIDLLAKFSWNIGLLHHQEAKILSDADPSGAGKNILQNRWSKLSDCMGRRVHFGYDVQTAPQYEARVVGLASDGGLRMMHLKDNIEVVEYGGEIAYLD